MWILKWKLIRSVVNANRVAVASFEERRYRSTNEGAVLTARKRKLYLSRTVWLWSVGPSSSGSEVLNANATDHSPPERSALHPQKKNIYPSELRL